MSEPASGTTSSNQEIRCLFVQSDYTIMVERAHAAYSQARDFLLSCAQLEKCPESIHTYRLTSLSLWNAAAAGFSSTEIVVGLAAFSRVPVPSNVRAMIQDTMAVWGILQLVRVDGILVLSIKTPALEEFLFHHPKLHRYFLSESAGSTLSVVEEARGTLKVELIKLGYPVEDVAGYTDGDRFEICLKTTLQLRDYQKEAASAFHQDGSVNGGSGVLVLPCGAGKTVIAIATMATLGMKTLILTPNVTAARQWRDELLDKTTLAGSAIGEYNGGEKTVAPITIATYQILTSRPKKSASFPHLDIFSRENWGLIIYDEVHMLPAPVFQITAGIQARRRLGLTATLVREDKREEDVFSLIGPKKFDLPWKVLEAQGWIASAVCAEVRVPMSVDLEQLYIHSEKKELYRIAATNPLKEVVVIELIRKHLGERILVIGMYLEQLHSIAAYLDVPFIDGGTKQKDRDALFKAFRDGEIDTLVVSKIANSSIDLPDASVAIQISGTFGSRQEEAQRLGRVLRPKPGNNRAFFYSVITENSAEVPFARNRQLFLLEQGYEYECIDFEAGVAQ
jgi:DNA excision repair protein ERCC-3